MWSNGGPVACHTRHFNTLCHWIPSPTIDDSFFQILLVTSSKDREKYVVPGGGVEPYEDPRNTAVREALEEAGVRGQLGRHIGVFEVNSHTNKFQMTCYKNLSPFSKFKFGVEGPYFEFGSLLVEICKLLKTLSFIQSNFGVGRSLLPLGHY